MIPALVIVVLNGAIVASAPPARLLFGHVMAPLAPVVTQFTERAALDGDTIALGRAGQTCVLHIGSNVLACNGVSRTLPVAPFGRGGVVFVPLAEIARALGGAATYDARTRVISLVVPPVTTVKSPAPFDPLAPQAAPTVIFTPSPPPPAPPAPQPSGTATPQPRRTAVPAVPSRSAG